MKVVNKKIDIVTWFDEEGIHPVRFRYKDKESEKVIKIDKVLFQYEEKFAGSLLKVFRCKSKINNEEKVYEIKYNTKECNWLLFKI
ncbi:hypothetical protein [Clostridium thermarum]|uniref:hypothetical protein n=1 Tax=Clostridium thermarum TaxID=1716543 RepID=UPI0013D4BC78|nr:hypothetical protein [Clostridium thermarum]